MASKGAKPGKIAYWGAEVGLGPRSRSTVVALAFFVTLCTDGDFCIPGTRARLVGPYPRMGRTPPAPVLGRALRGTRTRRRVAALGASLPTTAPVPAGAPAENPGFVNDGTRIPSRH